MNDLNTSAEAGEPLREVRIWDLRSISHLDKGIRDRDDLVASIGHKLESGEQKRRTIVRGPSDRLLALYDLGVKNLRERNNTVTRKTKLRYQEITYLNNSDRSQCNLVWYERLFNLSKERNEMGSKRRMDIAQRHYISVSLSRDTTASDDSKYVLRSETDATNTYFERNETVVRNIDACIVYSESADSALSEDSQDYDFDSFGSMRYSDYSEESLHVPQPSSSFDSYFSESSASKDSQPQCATSTENLSFATACIKDDSRQSSTPKASQQRCRTSSSQSPYLQTCVKTDYMNHCIAALKIYKQLARIP